MREEGEEDDQEAGEHPDVDEGGMLPLTPLFKAKVLSSTKMLIAHPASQADPIDWAGEVGEVVDNGGEEGEHEERM